MSYVMRLQLSFAETVTLLRALACLVDNGDETDRRMAKEMIRTVEAAMERPPSSIDAPKTSTP